MLLFEGWGVLRIIEQGLIREYDGVLGAVFGLLSQGWMGWVGAGG